MDYILDHPIDAVVFDCDGTLSEIEGIDELAAQKGAEQEVKAITEQAMSHVGINEELYQQRLDLVRPSRTDTVALADTYFQRCSLGISDVIYCLQRLNKTIYVLSAGVSPAVVEFVQYFGIPADHVFAVELKFDSQGNYIDFDRNSPLIRNNGKRNIIYELQKIHPRIVHVGDGLNDYSAYDLVTRFIGYGGAFYRDKVADACQFYIKTKPMYAILNLCLTQEEVDSLGEQDLKYYAAGATEIDSGMVKVSIGSNSDLLASLS